jgi:protein tyrosine/serine phosphatase
VVSQQSSTLTVDGLVNLRDLGGLPTESGATTLPGRLLRSESPHTLSDSGLRALLDLGIGAVVDLRTASEREHRPSPLVEAGVYTSHAPIFTDDEDYPDHLTTAAEVYCWWLRERRTGVAAAMTAIADAPSAPILVHCHAGKDRTGVIIALVLRLAGVSVDAIADDYAISGVQLAEMLARDRISARERGMDEVRAERIFTVRREAMVHTMDCVDSEHRGAVSLLRAAGLDGVRVERLSNLLLSPVWP